METASAIDNAPWVGRLTAAISGSANEAEARRLTEKAVLELTEPHRSVILYHYYQGWSVDPIARQLNAPPSSIQAWLEEAHTTLRQRLDTKDLRVPATIPHSPLSSLKKRRPKWLSFAMSKFSILAACVAVCAGVFFWSIYKTETEVKNLVKLSTSSSSAKAKFPALQQEFYRARTSSVKLSIIDRMMEASPGDLLGWIDRALDFEKNSAVRELLTAHKKHLEAGITDKREMWKLTQKERAAIERSKS